MKKFVPFSKKDDLWNCYLVLKKKYGTEKATIFMCASMCGMIAKLIKE
jgi:hypothetical protein